MKQPPRLPHGIDKPRVSFNTGKSRVSFNTGKPRLPPDTGKPHLPPDTGKPRLPPDIVNTLQQCLDGRIGPRTSLVYIILYVETGKAHERLHVGLNDFGYSCKELSDMRARNLSRWDILKEVISRRAPQTLEAPEDNL